MRPLFVMGASRSGTTALTDYLNEHEEILICMERYKWVPEKLTPELLTYQRIMAYEPRRQNQGGETSVRKERYENILSRKDPAQLKWIGDKHGGNPKRYRTISDNNPGAHFLITYRPIEEVVESFDYKTQRTDNLGIAGKDGLKLGVHSWNIAMTSAREYLEGYEEPNGLIVSYHDFFFRPADYVPLLSEFLELDFDDSILERWRNLSAEFEGRRREKEPVTEEKAEYIRQHKDHAAEEWMQERMARQWLEPGLYKRTVGPERGRQRLADSLTAERSREKDQAGRARHLNRRLGELQDTLAKEQERTASSEKRHRALRHRVREMQSSRSWRLLKSISYIRSLAGRFAKR